MFSRLNRLTAHWWFPPVAMWFATRLVSTALFIVVGYIQGPNYWTPAHPAYFDFLNIWDVEWYHRIFTEGYPTQLPIAGGMVQQNAWAFMPAFPFTVKALAMITGVDWKYLAPLIATLFSFLAAVIIYRLLTRYVSAPTATWSIALLGLWCASPSLQAGYADSMGLAMLALALLLIDSEKYLLAMLPTAVFALTRPGAIALTGVLVLVFIAKWWNSRKNQQPIDARANKQLFLSIPIAALLGLTWPMIAWLVTSRSDAYLATELAWRVGYTGNRPLLPMESWFIAAGWDVPGPVGVLLLFVLLAAVIASWFLKSLKSLGTTMRSWVMAYWLYLLTFFYPQSSTWRILIPLFPMFGVLAIKTVEAKPVVRGAMVLTLIGLQAWWLLVCWMYTAPDFTPP